MLSPRKNRLSPSRVTENHCKCKYINLLVIFFPTVNLWGQINRGTADINIEEVAFGFLFSIWSHSSAESKYQVGNFGIQSVSDENIAWLQVMMNNLQKREEGVQKLHST